MIAVAVRHQDQVDLADLAEILELGGILVAPMIQGSIMITLPPGVVSLKAAWLYHSNSALPWAWAEPASARQAATTNGKKPTQHSAPPLLIRQA